MTPAERKRRSRKFLGNLRRYSAPRMAQMLGGSAQFYRDADYVLAHGIPEWEQLRHKGKGKLIIGISTQRQMVKHLSPQDQLAIIELAKENKSDALYVWQLLKSEHGIE